MGKRRSNKYKLHSGRFHLDIGKKFFTARTIIDWNDFPRIVVVPITGGFQDVIGQGAR